MATIEIDQKWIDELEILGNDVVTDVTSEIESAIRHHLFKLRQAKISQERRYYEANHSKVAKHYLGQYIAIHNKKVVGSNEDGHELASQIRSKWGRVPIAIVLVEERPEPPTITLNAPRLGIKSNR